MVGNRDWNGEKFDVIQKRGAFFKWSGKVIVWKADKSWWNGYRDKPGYYPHGRREIGASTGNWRPGDRIQLKSCVDNSKNYKSVSETV